MRIYVVKVKTKEVSLWLENFTTKFKMKAKGYESFY
jgi:hypothetical protein